MIDTAAPEVAVTAALRRLLAVHVALVAAPILVVALVVGVLIHPVIAVLLAVLVPVPVAAWWTRGRAGDAAVRVRDALGAVEIEPGTEPRLENLVANTAMSVGVTVPRLHLIDDGAANAVVWGDGAGAGSLAATRGLLAALGRVELEAVIAHLLVRLRDAETVVPTVAFGLFGDRADRVLGAAPAPAAVIDVDLEAARLTRYPPGSVAALDALAARTTEVQHRVAPLAGLWVADPGDGGDRFPPLGDRSVVIGEL